MLVAPFPWFGGKSNVGPVVWSHLGDVDNYVEPFAGSLAVLLNRPANHRGRAETVNDLDMYLANFWRALQAAPEEVAQYADWPVNECDLTARHIWLVNSGRERLLQLQGDPDYYDAKVAGWWLWGICLWIGAGWCSGNGPWSADAAGKLVHLGDAGQGVNRQLVHLGDAGRGVNRQRQDITEYMLALADRLRRVRVCCGDWQRVITNGALNYGATVGVFLDPPYAAGVGRDVTLYNHETDVSGAVREWAIANGDNPRYRIALCGYEGEHTMPASWTVYSWKAGRSYGTATSQNSNPARERIWFSPGCVDAPLFNTEEQGPC
jgi:hypothetical protein